MAFETVATIISDVAIDLGLVSASIADPYGSADANILRLCTHLKRVGRDFLRAFPWSHLETAYTFSTADGTASYALPTDYARLIDETAWNRTQTRPMQGPLSPQQWEAEKARGSTSTISPSFRIYGGLFYIHSTPTAIETVAYRYISRYWVDTGGGTTPDAETPTTAADTLFFDADLLCAGLKYRYATSMGLPSEAAKVEFDTQWSQVTGADGAKPVLSLSGSRPSLLRPSIPDTGFGL